jgi:trehalose utilization protein
MNASEYVPLSFSSSAISRRAAVQLGATLAVAALAAPRLLAETGKRKVVAWSEGSANVDPKSKEIYPNDINSAIAEGLKPLEAEGWEVVKASLDDPEQGLSASLLESCSVLIWWGHKKHGDVKDELVDRIEKRVKEEGMGFIGTHSAHFSKPYKRLMGTRCSWREYVEDGTSAQIIVKLPDHPICKNVANFKLPAIERYGEPFRVPEPESVPLEGIYTKPDGSNETARMGLCWTVGKGRVFYFTPGHESYNDYFKPEVRRIMMNATKWVARVV